MAVLRMKPTLTTIAQRDSYLVPRKVRPFVIDRTYKNYQTFAKKFNRLNANYQSVEMKRDSDYQEVHHD